MRVAIMDLGLLAKHLPKITGRALPIEWAPGGSDASAPRLEVADTPEGRRALLALSRLFALHTLDPRSAHVLWLAHVRCNLSAPLRAGDGRDVGIYAAIGSVVGGERLPPEPAELPQRKGRRGKGKVGDRAGWLRLRLRAAERGARLYLEATRAWEGLP